MPNAIRFLINLVISAFKYIYRIHGRRADSGNFFFPFFIKNLRVEFYATNDGNHLGFRLFKTCYSDVT